MILRCPFCGHKYMQQDKIFEKNRCSNCGKSYDPNMQWVPGRRVKKKI